MRSLSLALAAMGVVAVSSSNLVVDDALLPKKWIFEATGNDKIKSSNTLSQKSRRKRRRQYLSQSFRKGRAA